jgi:protein-tyrosine phosphatase
MARSVLFVCTANICRSPTAEGVLRHLLRAHGGKKVEVASAGTHDYHVGEPPYQLAVECAARRGYDISGHIARRVRASDFDHFDLILAMDKMNMAHLKTIVPTRYKQSIELFLEYGRAHYGKAVPDPYGGQPKDYDLALDMIEDGCRGLVDLIAR